MPAGPPGTRSLLALLSSTLLALVALVPATALAADKRPSAVADLRYGVSLYQYYQQDYLAALSELQVAEERGGIKGHGNHPLVLEGAMSLAFGMDHTATQVFETALRDDASMQVRNAAWFYLARLGFRRGDWPAASASLDRIDGRLEREMADEVAALRVNLALRMNDIPRAEAALDRRNRRSAWQPYLYYNLGAANIRDKNPDRGVDYLDRLVDMKLDSLEHWAVQEKGLIAAGFSLMSQQDYAAAVERFSQVRLDSPVAEQALLGYGWSSAELGDFGQALGPWQILSDRSPLRPAVQEALLAVPYAYEKLGSRGDALREFELAEAVFSREIDRLEQLKTRLRPGYLVAALGSQQAAGEGDPALEPQLLGLVELLSGDRFALYRRDLQDLNMLGERLAHWDRNVAIYAAMLQQRRARRHELVSRMEKADYPASLERLQRLRDTVARRLAGAEEQPGWLPLADGDTLALWSRVERAEAKLGHLEAAGKVLSRERQRLNRYRGLLLWQISERALDWQWQAAKRLRQLDKALTETAATLGRLTRVVAEVPDILPFERRLQALEKRLQLQHAAVDVGLGKTEAAMQTMLVAELSRQQDRLSHYQTQARLARARLFDRASGVALQ